MTCDGPNEELIQGITLHAGCMLEWFFHAGWLTIFTILIIFVFMNASRVVLLTGLVKLSWR